MSELLAVHDLDMIYHDGRRSLKVLRNVNLKVQEGEALAIIGMSGAGKSTFLHLLGGLDKPTSGKVVFRGEDITKWSQTKRDHYRSRSIGFVFQFHHLLPEFNALENVMMPALVARDSKAEATGKAKKLLEQVGLTDRISHRPSKLSGGEQQRIALARALVNGPSLVLADEPTGNLDATTGNKIIDLLWKTTVNRNRSLIIVTHEPSIAEKADRVLVLKDGHLSEINKAELKSKMDDGAV